MAEQTCEVQVPSGMLATSRADEGLHPLLVERVTKRCGARIVEGPCRHVWSHSGQRCDDEAGDYVHDPERGAYSEGKPFDLLYDHRYDGYVCEAGHEQPTEVTA